MVLIACGPTTGGANQPPVSNDPTVTAIGIPDGPIATKTIGAAGGTVRSKDGMVDLLIPAGALSADTAISIQAGSSTAPGGTRAYLLQPEGTTFAVPVEITFHYDESDTLGSAAELLGIAFQTADRTWEIKPSPTLDTVKQTLTITSTHFSWWTIYETLVLEPPNAVVRAGRALKVILTNCETPDVTHLFTCHDTHDFTLDNWSVNGKLGGNADIGTAAATYPWVANFTAPAIKPMPTTVAVSARVQGPSGDRRTGLLVANYTIADSPGWQGTIRYAMTGDKQVTEMGTNPGQGMFTKTTRYTALSTAAMNYVSHTVQSDLDSVIYSDTSTGTYVYSETEDFSTVVQYGANCTRTNTSHSESHMNGPLTIPANVYTNIALTGGGSVAGPYFIPGFQTAGGDMTGTRHVTGSESATGCAPGMPTDMTYDITASVPTEGLNLSGMAEASPTSLRGRQTFEVDPDDGIPPRTYSVSWYFWKSPQ